MKDWSIITIIIGTIGALVGVYFRESLRKALRQKTLASKLEAQVDDMLNDIKSNDLAKLLEVVEMWQKDLKKALLEKGSKGLIDVEKEYETLLKKTKEQIENGLESVDEGLRKTYKLYKEMPESLFKFNFQHLAIIRDSLLKNIFFISDDEAAEISWDAVSRVVSVRGYLIEMIHQILSLMLTLREMDSLKLDVARPLVYKLTEKCIRMLIHLEPLRTQAKLIREKSITALTIANMLKS